MHNFIVAFASDLASVAIACFKTVFCMLPGYTTIFLTFYIVPEVIRWLVLPMHPYAFIVPILLLRPLAPLEVSVSVKNGVTN